MIISFDSNHSVTILLNHFDTSFTHSSEQKFSDLYNGPSMLKEEKAKSIRIDHVELTISLSSIIFWQKELFTTFLNSQP